MNETNLIVPASGALQQERTLEVIAGEIRTYSDLLAKSAIEIGRRLCEAKEMVPHGEFTEWVKINTGYSSSSASNFMRLFKEFSTEQGSMFGAEIKCQTFGNLNYTKALALISLPESERESFAQENDVEHLSVREVERLVKERTAEIEQERQREALARASAESRCAVLEGELTASGDELEKARGMIATLKAQPVATMEVRDEEAIKAAADEARAEVSKEYKALILDAEKELKEQKKAVEEATKARDKALKDAADLRRDMEKLKAAPAAEETVEKLRAQYEAQIQDAEKRAAEAEKQLKLADAGIAEFSAAFSRAQSELNAMHTALGKIADGETAAKLRKAACAVLDNFVPKFREVQA